MTACTERASALPQKNVVGRVGRAEECAGLLARPIMAAAHRIDALHGGDARECAAAAAGDNLELEPGNILRCCARRIAGGLADDGAAVRVLPARSRVMAPDGLAVREQRRDRLTEGPGELAVGARLALVDLR